MIWQKIKKSSFLILAVINGLLLGLIPIAPFIPYCIFDDCKGYENLEGGGHMQILCTCKYINWFLPFEALIIVVLAASLFWITFRKRIQSEFFIWQIVGIFSLLNYFLYFKIFHPFVNFWRVCHPDNNDLIVCEKPSLYENVNSLFNFRENELLHLAIIFGCLIVFNFIFALIVRIKVKLP